MFTVELDIRYRFIDTYLCIMNFIRDEKSNEKLKPIYKQGKRKSLPVSPEVSIKNIDKLKNKNLVKNSKSSQNSAAVNSNLLGISEIQIYRPLSREERASKRFCHTMYDKAAIMFECLSDSKKNTVNLEDIPGFETEFERRRAYSLAFAAKRYEAVLKDVLLDSAFYSSYFKLETFHHSKVMVMLLDYYEHNFRFSDTSPSVNKQGGEIILNHISEIQNAFFNHKIKLCSAFARNRIKKCALTLEGLLPLEVKERGECGSRHPLYVRVNTLKTSKERVIYELENDGFIMKNNLNHLLSGENNANEETEEEKNLIFCIDDFFEDLLVFPHEAKDDVFNHSLALTYQIIPQSKPRHTSGEIIKKLLAKLSETKEFKTKHINKDINKVERETGCILLTHPEAGSLAGHIASFLGENKRLIICGCGNNKKGELLKVFRAMNVVCNIELISEAFTDLSPDDERLKSVKIIICDPNCSKSGVVNPVDYVLYEGPEAAPSLMSVKTSSNLRSFVEKQRATLQHALRFELVQSILYMTFSMHNEENQLLIEQMLKDEYEVDKTNDSLFTIFPLSDILHQAVIEPPSATVQSGQDERFLSIQPTSLMDGFFIAVLKRSLCKESVCEVLERASKKGLLKKTENPKAAKKKPQKSHETLFKRTNSRTQTFQLSPSQTSKPIHSHKGLTEKKSSTKTKDDEDKKDGESSPKERFKF